MKPQLCFPKIRGTIRTGFVHFYRSFFFFLYGSTVSVHSNRTIPSKVKPHSTYIFHIFQEEGTICTKGMGVREGTECSGNSLSAVVLGKGLWVWRYSWKRRWKPDFAALYILVHE